jgi:GAF domain-containing protein
MLLYEEGTFRRVAIYGAPAEWAAKQIGAGLRAGRGSTLDRVLSTKRPVHIADLAAAQTYIDRLPGAVDLVEGAGARTVLNVPMLKDNEVVGIIAIYRQEVRAFTDKQIELVRNFAAQAVIAIENGRLLNELRESLDRQTATSEILGVISSSPGELQPVFEAMLENANRLCEAKFGNLFLREGDSFRAVAVHSTPAYVALWRDPVIVMREHPSAPLVRLASTKEILHIQDLKADQSYVERDPRIIRLVESAGARTLLLVPMLKENELIGAIGIY